MIQLMTIVESLMKVGYDVNKERSDVPIDWNNPDIQMGAVWSIPVIRKFLSLPKSYVAIYPAIVDVNELNPKLAEDDDDIPPEERGGYDWDEFRMSRKGFPPVLIRRTNGRLTILDGNHRIYWAQETNHSTIGAWVVDDDIQKDIEKRKL